jgi:hypothetical protein
MAEILSVMVEVVLVLMELMPETQVKEVMDGY